MSPERLRLYLSGPMTGIADHNLPAFAESAAFWRGLGFEVVNPGEVPFCDGWVQYMRLDLRLLLDCHAVVALSGCEKSKGARLEIGLANGLGLATVADSAKIRRQGESGALARIIRRRLERIGWAEMPAEMETELGVFVELTESGTKSADIAKQKEGE